MKLSIQTPQKALKAFVKQRPLRSEIEKFRINLIALLDKIKTIENLPKDETEEHLKNNVRDFLRDTYYKDTNEINTKDKKDLVIHLGNKTDSPVGVIIEAKRPSNDKEMMTAAKSNSKALWELILYYFDERVKANNFEIKQLVVTNINQWYIIDANYFDRFIYRNTQIKKLYETKQNDNKDNPWFYESLEKILRGLELDIPCVGFDIQAYDNILRNNNRDDDRALIALYKILSPQHLLKLATPNDSNSLNAAFYKELLHIIGLEESKEGGKNIIRRKLTDKNEASLIEATIEALNTEDVLHRIPDLSVYGTNKEERIFNISLELCITWINRILFLKLLEGQLVTYHRGNRDYRFLNTDIIHDYDELFKLFHKVLAVNIPDRSDSIKVKYSRVPYLNSSLFEISELEDQTIKVNSLDNSALLDLLPGTVLKEVKKKTPKLPTLDYLQQFLDAYDFASEGSDDVQEDNKSIITASVLGKVFEKINGYKDGSVFTPSFITMHMCRKSIRLAVVQKFKDYFAANNTKVTAFDSIEDIRDLISNKIISREEANKIINSLKICDPAVGSGHFLVSALNEIIVIKSELNILLDENGKTLRDYEIEIVNDELIITNENGELFAYNPNSKESCRVQKTLFQEKQTIIENCLFGVDINPNSVKICRLRLWIELLKNAYYRNSDPTGFKNLSGLEIPNKNLSGMNAEPELETLPNIDINIKCGNSLISRFALDADLKKALKKSKWNIESYRMAVQSYHSASVKTDKQELLKFINEIKSNFRTEIYSYDPKIVRLQKLQYEYNMLVAPKIFMEDAAEYGNKNTKKAMAERLKKYEEDINALQKQIDEIKNNAIYKNAFEWRFEFPEVLDDNGVFVGFDLVIGNPPYIKEYENKDAFNGLRNLACYQGKMDIWYLFGSLGLTLLKPDANLCYIATNNWVTNAGASNFRNIVIQDSQIISLIDFGAYMVFENAAIQTMIMLFKNEKTNDEYKFDYRKLNGDKLQLESVLNLLDNIKSENTIYLEPLINRVHLLDKPLTFNSDRNDELLNKIKGKHNFHLREKADKKKNIQSEIGQGIVAPQDTLNKAGEIALKKSHLVGKGIFVLSSEEVKSKNFTLQEKELIKPYYTTEELQKYYGNSQNKRWIIYAKSDIGKPDKKTRLVPINSLPNVKKHLDRFKDIITSDYGPYGLHRAREQYFFEGEKIMIQRKCPIEPIFTYTNFDCYVSQTFFVIQSDRINLKYLTGLLNSKIVAFWLRKKGKMQGNAYQLDKEPLLEIPIYEPDISDQENIATLVDKIISLKKENKDTQKLEAEIDQMVYKLYELTPEEIKIVEGE